MTALVLSLVAKFWPYLIGGAGVLLALWKARQSGVKAERAKRALRDMAAREDRLEMDREATQAERKAAGMTDDEARKEAMKWSRP